MLRYLNPADLAIPSLNVCCARPIKASMGHRPLTRRVLGVYVPTGLFFWVTVRISCRPMVGSLEPEAINPIGLLALPTTLLCVGAGITGLVLFLASIERWLSRNDGLRPARTTDGQDTYRRLLLRPRGVATRVPRAASALLLMATWVCASLDDLVLTLHGETFELPRSKGQGVAFISRLLSQASFVSVRFLSRLVGPNMVGLPTAT